MCRSFCCEKVHQNLPEFDPNSDVVSIQVLCCCKRVKLLLISKDRLTTYLDHYSCKHISNTTVACFWIYTPLVSDPYVRVTFSYQSQVTETLTQTLCPTWDQTLIFKEVDIFDNPKDLVQNPPSVVMEIFDYDKVSK